MSRTIIKFYVIPGIIALLIIIILLLIPINNKKTGTTISPIPTKTITLPTKMIAPDSKLSPTTIPFNSFTGADINQELPQNLKSVGEQKTKLRRLTPLTLPFGIINFDYENDIFNLTLNEPKEESQKLFDTWRQQNYPALSAEKFAIR